MDLSSMLDITETTQEPEKTGSLDGKTFCLTGTLTRPRKEMELLIKSSGGKISSSVTRSLSFLLLGTHQGRNYPRPRGWA